MRILSFLVSLLFATLIGACGGGGGSPGTVFGPSALKTNAPADLILLVGTAQSFSVTGGTGPYTAISNNELVAVAGVTGGTLTIGTVGIGTATITVRDAVGATVQVALTSAVAHPLSTTAGSAITIEMGSTQSYRVDGGVPGYSATSANPNVAAVSLLSGVLRVTGITPGSTSVLVRDGIGTNLTIAVTVTTVGNLDLFTTAPTPLTVPLNTAPTFGVGGGVGPYTATSSNPAIATVALVNNTLTITGLKAGSTSVTVRDSVNKTVVIAVTVPAPDAVFTTAPTPLTIGIGSSAAYEVGGGIGPYTVSSNNVAVATGVITNTTTLTITGVSAGSAKIVVRDTTGSTATIDVTVPAATVVAGPSFFTNAPSAISLATGGTVTFTLAGGTAPYTAVTNNSAVATVTQPTANTYRITGISAGSATITLKDAVGAVLSVGVGVTASTSTAPAIVTTAPATVTIAAGTTQTYSVSGGVGTATYTITNTNPFIASAQITGSPASPGTLTIAGLIVGNTTLTIRDQVGTQTIIAVSVIAPGSTLQLLPATLSIDERNNGLIELSIFGGVGPYSAFTTDALLAPVTVSGQKLQLTAVASRCVSANSDVTLTVIDSLGASATSKLTIVDTNAGVGCAP